MNILENVEIPEHIQTKAQSLDAKALDSLRQVESNRPLYAAFYLRPDHLETGTYGIVECKERDCFLYGVVFNEDGAIVTRQEKAIAEADYNMREQVQIVATFDYDCPARLNKQAQIDAVTNDFNRLLDADSTTDVECISVSVVKHKSEAELYSNIRAIEVTLPSEIPEIVTENAQALNPETFVDIEPLQGKDAFVARYLNDQNLRCYGQSLISSHTTGKALTGIVIKANGTIPAEAEARELLLGPKPEQASLQRNQATRLLEGLRSIYEDEPDDLERLAKDALCDLRHYCNVHGLSFSDIDKKAHELYLQEKFS